MATDMSTRAEALRYAADQIHAALHALADDAESRPAQFYTPKEAAAQLRLTVQTIYRWCADGTLESKRVGDRVLIPVEAVRKATS